MTGPSRVTMMVSPNGTNSITWYGSFDHYEV